MLPCDFFTLVLTEDSIASSVSFLEPREQDVSACLYTVPFFAGLIQELQIEFYPSAPVKTWDPLGNHHTQ